jgi:cystathionine beta-lyase/cystathionine gamma-synthase
VQLVDEQDDVLGAAHFGHYGLDALLKLAAVFGAGDHHCKVKHHDAAVTQQLRHVAGDHFLREAFHDPRFKAAAARFWEIVYGRKQLEASEALGRNLKALEAARGVLASAGVAAIPIYVQAALNAGNVDGRALEWSQWELMKGLHAARGACASFSFGQLGSYGLPPASRLAAHYLHYAYGDPYAASVSRLCAFGAP